MLFFFHIAQGLFQSSRGVGHVTATSKTHESSLSGNGPAATTKTDGQTAATRIQKGTGGGDREEGSFPIAKNKNIKSFTVLAERWTIGALTLVPNRRFHFLPIFILLFVLSSNCFFVLFEKKKNNSNKFWGFCRWD